MRNILLFLIYYFWVLKTLEIHGYSQGGDLHYAYMGNGNMGRKDYEYLTYNDLFNVQNKIIQIKGVEDYDIRVLMEFKKGWMDKNGITQYKK